MGRPNKQTADYFSHDANASDSRTVGILENHFGLEGYAVWFKLQERLCGTNNHVIACKNKEDSDWLAAKMKIPPPRFLQILDKLADLGEIDKELWAERVIWSQSLVDRLDYLYNRRQQDKPSRPVLSGKEPPVIASRVKPC